LVLFLVRLVSLLDRCLLFFSRGIGLPEEIIFNWFTLGWHAEEVIRRGERSRLRVHLLSKEIILSKFSWLLSYGLGSRLGHRLCKYITARLRLLWLGYITKRVVGVFLIDFLFGCCSLNFRKGFTKQILELLDVVSVCLATGVRSHIKSVFRPRLI
jgi:hypothetical protein